MPHTPTPWKQDKPYGRLIRNSRGLVIAETHYRGLDTDGDSDANAALIVRSVNSHEALVEAAQAVYDYFETRLDRAVAIRPAGEDKMRRMLGEALALARKEM